MDQPIPLRGPVVRLGRAASEDVQLSDPRVSRRHAVLEEGGGGWRLVDQGSRHGTRVNGQAVAAGAARYLQDGDVLELGNARLRYAGGQLWVPAGTLLGAAAAGAPPGSPGLIWLGAGLVIALLLWLQTPAAAPPQRPEVNTWATQRAVEAALTAQAPTLQPPITDTPAPRPTVRPTRKPGPTTVKPTAGGPTVPPAPEEPSRTPIAFPPDIPAGERLVLADYFAWYDNWDLCNVSGGDRPAEPYHSDDAGAIRRQVQQALGAGIDGFTLHWVGQGDRTDSNFARLLQQSRGTRFASTVVVEQHFFQGRKSLDEVAGALRYLMDRYAGDSNFLRWGGRPVLFFVDMDRIDGSNGITAARDAWAEVRRRVDPNREAIWIAEGDNSALPYLDVFDGLYTYRVVHRGMPSAYQKLPRYAQQLRAKANAQGRRLLWVATIMPGWDDERSTCMADVRKPAPPFKRDRENGAFYRATFETALGTAPDILYVNSFNEWVEGHYIEPSALFGDLYLRLTGDFAARFKQGG